MSEYIPSTTPGKTWSVGFYKPQGRPGYVSAMEGERIEDDSGFTGFRCRIGLGGGGDRRLEQKIEGTCTAKRKAQAREVLLATMREQGLIEGAQ